MSTNSYYHTTSQGSRLFVEETGSGPLMICMHGLGGSTNVFQPLVRHFSPQYTVLRFDFYGSGLSKFVTVPKQLSIPYFLKDLEDVIASKGHLDTPPILVGHSLGSIVAMHYAAKHSQTPGLVLIGPGRSAAHIPAAVNRMVELASKARGGMEFITDFAVGNNVAPGSSEIVRSMFRQTISTQDPEGYAMTCEALSNTSHVDPDYAMISCPTMLIAGIHDNISPRSRSEELQKLIGGDAKVAVVNSAHAQVLEDTEGVVEAIQRLLASIQ